MKRSISMFLTVLVLCLLAVPVFGASDEPVIQLQPQQPYYPEYSVASYRVKVTGTNLTATWYLEYQGQTYNLSDNTNGMEPWEAYAGESYGGVEEEPGNFVYFFSGIGAELSGSYIWCVIEDGHYSVTSRKALVTVGNYEMPPVIEEIPSQLSVEVGDDAQIRCIALAPGDSQLEYLWYVTPTGRLEDMTAVNRGSETSDFLICDTRYPDSTYYICCITSSDGGITYSSAVEFTVTEKVPEAEPPRIITSTVADATAGQPYSCKLSCSDSNAQFYIYYNPGKANDFEKTGLKLSEDGTISGTPTAAGDYTFCVCAAGPGGEDYMTYTLHVNAPKAEEPTQPGKTPGSSKPGADPKDPTAAPTSPVDPTVPAPTAAPATPAAPTAPQSGDPQPSQQPENGFPWLILIVVSVSSAGIGIAAALLITRKRK